MSNQLFFLRSRFKNLQNQFPYIRQTFRLIWTASKGWTLAWVALLVLQGILPIAVVLLTRVVVDSLVMVLEGGTNRASLQPLIFSFLIMGAVLLTQELMSSFSNYIRTAQSERVRDYISEMVFKKSVSVDLAFYDSAENFDHLYRATFEAGQRPVALLESAGSLLQSGITMISMAVVLTAYGWWLPFVLFLSTLPAFFVVLKHKQRHHHWSMATTRDERRVWYYQYNLTSRDSAPELRLFQLGDLFRSNHQKLRLRLREEKLKLIRDQGLSETLAGVIALVITGFAMIWMIVQIVEGLYSLGDLALFYSAFNQGQKLARTLLSGVGEIYSNSLFLSDLFQYLELESLVKSPEIPIPTPASVQNRIQFNDVSFHYTESERNVVQHFNLEIPSKGIVAIVGPNGAGKSTLVKLLCRFYDPQSGSIMLDGVNLRNYDVNDLRRHITVLFQMPMHYQETAATNIAFGDVYIHPEPNLVSVAAKLAGVDEVINRLPQGYDTMLGKWFEPGTDLSVGEWQRIALARAFYRQAPIVILDEPTSAMDPWAEADWLRRFRKLAESRTTIIITHRFSTAAYADAIHVMDEGRIIESGTHQELLRLGGQYAQSWKDQMERWFPGSGVVEGI